MACEGWCSRLGFCGTGSSYEAGAAVDCRGCKGLLLAVEKTGEKTRLQRQCRRPDPWSVSDAAWTDTDPVAVAKGFTNKAIDAAAAKELAARQQGGAGGTTVV